MHHVVSWERLAKKEPTMCLRCQRFGHSAINCNLDFRCVKCEEKHEPGDCTLITRSAGRSGVVYVRIQLRFCLQTLTRQDLLRICRSSAGRFAADPAARLTHPIAPSEGRICCGSAVHLPADPALSDPAVHLLTDCRQGCYQGKIKKGEKIDLRKIYCVRCREYGHPASYKGCPKYREIKNRLINRNNNRGEKKNEDVNSIKKSLETHRFKPGISFAQIAKGNNNFIDIGQSQINSQRGNRNEGPYTQRFSELPKRSTGSIQANSQIDLGNIVGEMKKLHFATIGKTRKFNFPKH